jgi:diketogulonate reductase-like aldo/keto reductase
MIFGTVESFDQYNHAVALGNTGIDIALQLGFEAFDTAPSYGNQHEMSFPEGTRIISKLPFNKFGYDDVIESFNKEHLPITDYYIHWPFMNNNFKDEIKGTWEAFEYLHDKHNIKIGVCNFTEKHLQRVFQSCSIPPEVNQFELNLKCQNRSLIDFCKQNHIEVQSYASIRRGELEPVQGLGWLLGLGVTPIVRSRDPLRLKQYQQVADSITMSEYHIRRLEGYHTGERFCPDPYDIPS